MWVRTQRYQKSREMMATIPVILPMSPDHTEVLIILRKNEEVSRMLTSSQDPGAPRGYDGWW